MTSNIRIVPSIESTKWTTLELAVPDEVSEILSPTSVQEPNAQTTEKVKPVRGVKLVKTEDDKYHLLVHKKELTKPLTGFVLALKNAIERFGIPIDSIATAEEDTDGPRCPTEIHPNLRDWMTWLSNPSALDWSKSKIDLSPIVKFIYDVVLHGRQPYLNKRDVSSRSELYINSAINIICKLYLIDKSAWIHAFWHNIPKNKRERKNIQFHSLKKFETVMATAELKQLPPHWNTIKERQEAVLDSYLNLTGTHVEYKLKRLTNEVVNLVGKPFLKIMYDRIRIRNELISRNKNAKNVVVRLSDVLNEGLRRDMYSCLPYAPVCALHRRNYFGEMRSVKRLPVKFNETVDGLPFECRTMADYARYCRENRDLSNSREEDLSIEALSDTDVSE